MSWHNNSSRCNSLKIIALRVNVMSDEFFEKIVLPIGIKYVHNV